MSGRSRLDEGTGPDAPSHGYFMNASQPLEERLPEPSSGQAKEHDLYGHGPLREYFVTIMVCTIFALFVTTYVVHPMTVPTPSMEPTILVGDRLLIDKFNFRNGFYPPIPLTPRETVERGDVVVFKYPQEPEVLYVKRAIGLPGETLEVRDKVVYINGTPLKEPYAVHSDSYTYPRADRHHLFSGNSRRDNYGPVVVPEHAFFVMGDNRDDSADSRYFGFLPEDHIVGSPFIVFWSYEDQANAYLKSSLPELFELYSERVLFFFTRTRWARLGRVIR